MTKSRNKKNIRVGLVFTSISLFSLFAIINREELGLNFLKTYSPIVLFFLSALGFASFIFLFILGIFPHFVRLDRKFVASEKQKSNPIYFFGIED